MITAYALPPYTNVTLQDIRHNEANNSAKRHTFLKADQGATSSMYRLPLLEMASAASRASCILKSSYAASAFRTCARIPPQPGSTSCLMSNHGPGKCEPHLEDSMAEMLQRDTFKSFVLFQTI